MTEALRRLARERVVARRHLGASVAAALQLRCLVTVSKGFVELSEIGKLAALGLATRDARLALIRPMRADRTGGEPILERRAEGWREVAQ